MLIVRVLFKPIVAIALLALAVIELSEIQLFIVAAVVSVIVWILRILGSKLGIYPGREIIVGVIFIVSVVLGVIFVGLEFPSGGLEAWLEFLVMQIGLIAGWAWAVYQIILKGVFDKISANVEALAFRKP